MKSSIDYYLVEGECEDRFIRSSDLIGKIELIDVSEKNVSQLSRWSTKLSGNKKRIFLNIVFDTDVLATNQTILLKFIDNIRFLKKQGFNIRLLQQHLNFEDELCLSLGVTKADLFAKFNARNSREFKQNLIADQNRFKKLNEINPCFNLWSSECIDMLGEFSSLMHNYDSLPKKPNKG